MSVLATLWQRRRTVTSVAVVTSAALTVSTLAFLSQGVPTADVRLNDGGVWVTNSGESLLGHLNYPSRVLDGALRAKAGDFDVQQDGNNVLLVDETGGTITPVDPAKTAGGSAVSLPKAARSALGGSTVAVVGDGRLFAVPFVELTGATFDKSSAVAKIAGSGSVAVSKDGDWVFAVSRDSPTLTAVHVAGGSHEVTTTPLSGAGGSATLQITAVGDVPVVFDPQAGAVYLADGSRHELPGSRGGVLQQASGQSDSAYIATASALVRQPLSGSNAQRVAKVAQGTPSAPVSLNGCAYAVWSGSGAVVRACDTVADDLHGTIRSVGQATLTLRTNRDVVVVNDTSGGNIWLVDNALKKVGNWDEVAPQQQLGDDSTDTKQQQQQQLPQRSAENHPPTAVDHSYGVRPGRTTILPVTDGCTDPDGDLLTATLAGAAPAGYTITPVLQGSALQVAVPAAATGTVGFRYAVSDGRGGTAEAAVTLKVHPLSENTKPTQPDGPKTIHVEVGASVTYDALDGWSDAEGDDLYLASATVSGGDTVSYRSNGQLVFTASSGQTGTKTVRLGVSDGQLVGSGSLNVVVDPKGSQPPVANSDRATATAGIPITIAPLSNDSSLNGQPLRLSKVDSPAGASVTPDYSAGTVRFSAAQAGTYYVQYQVTAGTAFANGLIRIDVTAKSSSTQPPTAARALALLPVGGTVLVDPLANDTDPQGGILVLQAVHVPSGAGISAEVLDHSVIRVTDIGQLLAPVQFSYVVSNGSQTATGEIAVVPVPVRADVPPVAVPDTATVQVGQVVNIPVLANDYSPGNGTFTIDDKLIDLQLGKGDVAFVADGQVRFEAGTSPESATLTYTITDKGGNRASALVTVHVVASEAAAVQPPTPRPVVARVVAGTTARIPIPLDGIDPNGSTVRLVGVASSPAKGSAGIGDTWITYTADPNQSGMDTFTYRVRDLLGAEAQGTISVGIAAPTATPQPPYTARDTVSVRPGRSVAVDVLANDSDPDGSTLSLLTNGLTVPSRVNASVTGGRVLVKAPQSTGTYAITYTVMNTFGATARGSLIVRVDPSAPLLAPIARDDYVSPAQVGADLTVTVPVLDNDEDPDGTVSDLVLAVPGGAATVTAQNRLSVRLKAGPQVIRYTITDPDGLVGQAFLYVPGTSTLVPTLNSTKPIVVTSGQKVGIALADYVKVRDGRVPRVATADSVRIGHSDGSNPVVSATSLQYTSAKGYYGSDALGVLVTDGTGPDDPRGLSAYIMIPITVEPAGNLPPRLRSTSVTVGQGEKAAAIDLGMLAFDPNPGDKATLSYGAPQNVPIGITAKVSGSTLSVSADAGVAAGTTGTFSVTVRDAAGATGTGTITVNVVTSTRPLPIAVDIAVPDAQQGKTVTVDALAQDYNPFAADGKALTLASANVASGDGTADVQGGSVSITPGPTFFGTLVVAYTIADATKAASRQATGHIIVTVAGKPGQPTVPAVVAFASHTVTLSWQPPDSHGAPITAYTLTWTGSAGGSQQCASTTCTVTGLTNAIPYTFRVAATNKAGDSLPSLPSAPVTPDAIPDAPAAPSTVFGDQSLALTWVAPHSDGSPVTSYNLQISPAPASGASLRTGVTGTSTTLTGLTNGVSYQVQVQAVNRAGASDWSPWSIGTVPAGKPDAPTGVTASFAPSVGSQAQIAVSWSPPANTNGDAIASYTVVQSGGDGQGRSQTVNGTSASFAVGTSTSGYTFTVTATNKAGASAPSAPSAPVRAANAPDAPASVAIAATGVAGQFKVTITPGGWNGNAPSEVSWQWVGSSSGTVSVQSASSSAVVGLIDGAANGQPQSVQVWGRSTVTGGDGARTGSNQAKPWGPLLGYTPSANPSGAQVCFSWDVSGALDGQQLASLTYSAQGGQAGSGGVTGSACSGSAYYSTFGFTLTVHTVEGNSAVYTASGSTGANPNRSISLSRTGHTTSSSCGTATCAKVVVNVSGYAPNTAYSGAVWTDCAGYGAECTGGAAMPAPTTNGGFSFTTDGNGNASVTTNQIFGFPGAHLWAVMGGDRSPDYTW